MRQCVFMILAAVSLLLELVTCSLLLEGRGRVFIPRGELPQTDKWTDWGINGEGFIYTRYEPLPQPVRGPMPMLPVSFQKQGVVLRTEVVNPAWRAFRIQWKVTEEDRLFLVMRSCPLLCSTNTGGTGNSGTSWLAGYTHEVVVRNWVMVLLPSILPILSIQSFLRRRIAAARRTDQCCEWCGYDCRSSAGRCPECGNKR